MKPILIFLVIPLLAASCSSGRVTTSERVADGSDPTYSTSTSYSLHGDKDEARLERAALASTSGDYQQAIAEYMKVYRHTSVKPESMEKALFGLGSAWSNLLNPRRDFQKALQYLEELVKRFPESDLRPRAEEKIVSIRGIVSD